MSAEFIQFIPRPRHKRISRRLLFALGRMIPPWPTPMLPQASLLNRRGGKPSVAKTLVEIRSLARSHTRTAIRVLVGVMRCNYATPAARVSAANAVLDPYWGKATQPQENSGEGALQLIQRIARYRLFCQARFRECRADHQR